MAYHTEAETENVLFLSSRLGDVVMRNKNSGEEVYFQPGDAGSEVLSILDESPPDRALDIWADAYWTR